MVRQRERIRRPSLLPFKTRDLAAWKTLADTKLKMPPRQVLAGLFGRLRHDARIKLKDGTMRQQEAVEDWTFRRR